MDYTVSRYGIWNETAKTVSGDFIRVGNTELGEFLDLVQAEYERAGSAFNMRAMWYSGSHYGKEILELAKHVRG